MKWLFKLAVAFFLVSAFVHISELTHTWNTRHFIFLIINLMFVYLCLKRPRFFISILALLTAQQLFSHGSQALEIWQTTHTIDWISVLICLGMPALLFFAIIERKSN